MLRTTAFAIIGAATLSSAFAGISNGNFESFDSSGNPLEWSFINGGVTNNYNGLLACEQEFFGYADSTGFAAIARNAEEFLDPQRENILTFCYNFFTNEPTGDNDPSNVLTEFNDKFELRLLAANGASATYLIADVFTASMSSANARPSNFGISTGWQMKAIDISAFLAVAGQPINVLFQVTDAGDANYASGFGIDAVEAVPEPGTMAALALGGAVLARRRRK